MSDTFTRIDEDLAGGMHGLSGTGQTLRPQANENNLASRPPDYLCNHLDHFYATVEAALICMGRDSSPSVELERLQDQENAAQDAAIDRESARVVSHVAKTVLPNAFNKYQSDVMRTAATSKDPTLQFAVLGLGISGEAGEVSDIIKKVVGHGHELTPELKQKLSKELGDVLWYVAALADHLGFDLSSVANANIEKLKARYPNGFERERSINRAKED